MPKGFELTETDNGTKRKTRRGLDRARKYNAKFKDAIMRYWWRVFRDARNNLIMMGAFDTGTLYKTIRIEFGKGGMGGVMGGPTFEITAGPDRIQVTGLIRAGGMLINPKTGKICNYAESVHDGTGKNMMRGPRPFLTQAIAQNEAYLQQILNKFADELCKKVVSD